MRMKRKVIASLVLLGSIVTTATAEQRDCLTVHLASGGKVFFPLTEEPVITFDGGVVTIATGRYQISEVRKYTFDDFATDIENAEGDGTAVDGYSPDGRFFSIRLKDASVPVRLRTAGGIEVPRGLKPDGNGVIRIDMSRLGQDIYLLTVGNETIKIRRQ